MRIHYLITQDLDSAAGLGRYGPMAKELSRLGHSVVISALHPRYSQLHTRHFTSQGIQVNYIAPMHIQKSGNIKIYYSPIRLLMVAMRATIQFVRYGLEVPADLIHIGKPHPMNSIAGLLAKRLKKIPVLLDCDDYEVGLGNFQRDWMKRVIGFFENWTPGQVDLITTNTFFTKDRIMRLGIPESKLVYLSNGVDLNRFRHPDHEAVIQKKTELNLHGDSVITYVGTLSLTSHPVNLLLEAFPIIQHSLPNTKLLIVGGGEDYEKLRILASELEIAANTIFAGRVDPASVPIYYALSTVTVDPVHDDLVARGRSPLKMFESWAMGVPFVTADVGDRRRLFGDPPAGILAQAGDAKSLAAAILAVLQNQTLANTLIQTGKKRAAHYSWDRLGAEIESIYQSVLDRRSLG